MADKRSSAQFCAHGSIAAAAEFKFANTSEPGSFDGYASVFNVVDGGADVVMPGAFADTLADLKRSGRQLPMYMMHGRALGADPRPVGVWDHLEEDAKGLKARGHLVGLDTETGKYNHSLVKEGAMRGLSIGYRAVKTGMARRGDVSVREIKQAKLFEVSIVDDPMNAQARMLSVKAAAHINSVRDFEKFLRDEGFSNAAARGIAERGFNSSEPRDEDDAIAGLLLGALQRTRKSFR